MKRLSKTKKFVGGVALALVLMAAAAIGLAAQGRGGNFGGKHGGVGRLFNSLDLSEAQKTQIEVIAERHRQSTAQLREQLKASGAAEEGVLTGGQFNEQAVRAAAQARAAAHVEAEVAHARMFSEMYAVLTPEQQAKLAERRRTRGERRQQWQQRRSSIGSESRSNGEQ